MPKYTTEEYQTLKSAYAEGVRKVKYSDREVEYASTEEMRKILEEMEQDLFPKTNKPNRRRTLFSINLHG